MRKYRQYAKFSHLSDNKFGVYDSFQDFITRGELDVRGSSEHYTYYGSSNCNYILSHKTGNIYENFGWHGKNLFEKLTHNPYYETEIINRSGYIGYIIASNANFDYNPADDYKVKRLTKMMDNLCNKIILAENGNTYLAYSRMQEFIKELHNSLYDGIPDNTSFLHALEYYVKISKEYTEIWE